MQNTTTVACSVFSPPIELYTINSTGKKPARDVQCSASIHGFLRLRKKSSDESVQVRHLCCLAVFQMSHRWHFHDTCNGNLGFFTSSKCPISRVSSFCKFSMTSHSGRKRMRSTHTGDTSEICLTSKIPSQTSREYFL